MEREQAVEAISELARGTRAGLPRWLWILSLGIGAVCAAAFVVALVVGGDPASASEEVPAGRIEATGRGGLGFSAGFGIGGAVGIVIGMAIARQRRRER